MIGIDTNVLIYCLDSSDDNKHNKALKILKNIHENPNNYVISLQVLAELYYVVAKKYKTALNDAKELINLLIDSVKVVNYGIPEIRLAMQFKIKFWDYLIGFTYINNGVSKILTENVNDFSDLKININNPFD